MLDSGALSLWRRDQCLRSWALSDIGAQWRPGVRPGDGATLLICSGSLQAAAIDLPPLSQRDRTRYLAQQVAHMADGSCGAVAFVDSDPVVQCVKDAPALVELLCWFSTHGVRFRRIRHIAQLADVTIRCLREPPAQAVMGWSVGGLSHLCAVRQGVTLWHRVLVPGTDLGNAFTETIEHVGHQSLFDPGRPVSRLWFGEMAEPSVPVDYHLEERSLMHALRRPVSREGLLTAPVLLASVLSASHSDLRPAVLSQQWQRAVWVRGVTCGIALICALLTMPLWQFERARQHQLAVIERSVFTLDAVSSDQSNEFATRQWLAERHAEVRGQPITALSEGLVDIASSLSALPVLGLEAVVWRDTEIKELAALQVAVSTRAPNGWPRAVSSFAENMAARGWTISSDLLKVLATEPADLPDQLTLDFVEVARAQD